LGKNRQGQRNFEAGIRQRFEKLFLKKGEKRKTGFPNAQPFYLPAVPKNYCSQDKKEIKG